ncbi:serine hydrolase [Streptomyces sp. IB201691-2A2]|uniref:serine hydrolase domain-containing protein n=1 Tax=Streptomyces sp. IB201691-2A2 TaxID=2561920 RepID=UPI00117CB1CB|nr:serine hydrolase domain-containing protein [Streptomyces sp. IB201691-2A2]TRO62781.1 class A beta-lactamase-related serine hydrolase [Streptomyces sp. IB201691-2A2]
MANLRGHKRRWRTVASAGAVAAVLVVGTVPAVAAGPGHGVDRSDRGRPGESDRGLDKEALRGALAGLPDENVTGGLIRMSGTDGRWSGTAGPSVPSSDAHFRIGSVTKIFTSTVLLQLAAERRLTLDDTVQELMPGLLPAGYYPVTVGQLLSHTSGLQIMTCATEDMSPREAVDASLACGEPTEPGKVTRYNGINYFIAGLIIEQVTGHTYGSEVRARILKPLRLRDTYVPALDDWSIPAPYTRGLVAVPGSGGLKDVSVQNPFGWAEGGMISNAPDLARFFTALYRGRLLPPAQQKDLFRMPAAASGDTQFSYGGLQRTEFPDGTVVWGKSGHVPGYTSGAFATRDLRRLLVYALNPTDRTPELPYVMRIAGAAFDVPVPATAG